MAFVFTLSEDEDPPLRIAEKAGEILAVFDIGYDDESLSTYKGLVALVPAPGRALNEREIYFLVNEVHSDGTEFEHKSGQHTRLFLKGGDRSVVLTTMGYVACFLAERCEAQLLIMNTVETYLPPKALKKYGVICGHLRKAGFVGGKVDSYHGSEQWLLSKN